METLDSALVKALWDPGNDINATGYLPPYPNGYQRLKPHIVHMHLKDRKAARKGSRPAMLLEGDVDYGGRCPG